MSDDKIKGKVKWYSIRKGFGFISPLSDNAPTTEDIFFHQTSIVAEGKTKFLATDYEVEFEVNKDDDGKYRCQNVTAPGGGPCEIPARPERKRRRNKGKGAKKDGAATTDDEEGGGKSTDGGETDGKEEGGKDGANKKKGRRNRKKKGGGGDKSGAESGDDAAKKADNKTKKPRAPRKRFDDGIPDDVKEKMKAKKLDMRQTSLLIQLDKARIKFGPEGYAALAHADGIMAEGTFSCDSDGKVTFTWKNMLKFEDDEWKTQDPISNTSDGTLAASLNWTDENVQGLKGIETPESLWGEGKTDPADALEKNGFQMKKCFLAKNQQGGNSRGRRRPNRGGKKGGDAKNGEKANGEANGEKTNGKAENGTAVAAEADPASS